MISRLTAVAFVGVVVLMGFASTGGAAAQATCQHVPKTLPASRLLLSGSRRTVPIGAIVYSEIVEPAKYGGASYPTGFPWLAATSHNRHVLTPVALCEQTAVSTLVLKVAAFRATHAGVVTLTAPLAARWRTLKTGPRPYRATVTVG
jgi:hypothetical protein